MMQNGQPIKLDTAEQDGSDELEESFSGEEIDMEMLSLIVESNETQLEIALGLTKIITDKTNINQPAQVLEIFKQAYNTVNEISSLKRIAKLI